MRLLTRAVFREVASAAVLGTVLFAFVIFLQKLNSGKYFEVLLRGSATPSMAAYLFALVLPPVLGFALPIGSLVGVLIGLGRMSADGEITAMRAAGVPSRRVALPILLFAAIMMMCAGTASLWLTPVSIRETYRVFNTLIARQLSAEITPRVFAEQFTSSNTILYVGDVIALPGTVAKWRNVFIADLTPPEERSGGGSYADSPAITVATEAIAVPDPVRNSIQLSMTGTSSHQAGSDPGVYYNTYSPRGDQLLQAKPREEQSAKAWIAMDTRPLLAAIRAEPDRTASRDARVELHQRFSFPIACLLLAVIGIPIGVSTRKGGKSGAMVITVALVFLYWMMQISLIKLAQQDKLPVEVAVWLPNVIYALAGILMLFGIERPGDRDLFALAGRRLSDLWAGLRSRFSRAPRRATSLGRLRIPLLPGVVDTYVLGEFLFYFAMLLTSFVLMAHVFIFFELLGDIFSRGIPWQRVATYHFFLTPKLIYDSAPMSVLVAVLVTFGILSKNNEVIAMKACGVSLYRMSAPILIAATVMSGALFAFDHYYIPDANRIQDGILNEIKGRPVQTYLRPDRKWIYGEGSRIFYYKYFDSNAMVMAGVNVYEIDPNNFRLRRHISAESASWEPRVKGWIFQHGWTRDFDGVRVKDYRTFTATLFDEITETPSWFLKEVKQEKQLNFIDLDRYIRELQQAGFDTIRLKVQYHKKFSVPLFVLIMALISVPFAFLTGNRGAMAGVGVSFTIAIAYWASSRMFEEIGNLAELPPSIAAWSPDALFSLAGLYLFTRMRS
ncbi:MAG: LptF/LptG family permease [Bryobacterales bacterium]|nr:LptF/LptG family permease [Bryobacterales bacterium]